MGKRSAAPGRRANHVRRVRRQWLKQRVNLRPRAKELYESELRLHLLPRLGTVELSSLTPARVRSWHAELLNAGVGPIAVAKCYRLLRAILSTAVEDGVIVKNPCVIKGQGSSGRPREVATVEQVFALAAAIDPRFRAMVSWRPSPDCGWRVASVVAQLQELTAGSSLGLRRAMQVGGRWPSRLRSFLSWRLI